MVNCGDTVPGKGFYCCNQTLGNRFVSDRPTCCASDPFASCTSCPGSLGCIAGAFNPSQGGAPSGCGGMPAVLCAGGCGINIPIVGGIQCWMLIGLGVAIMFFLITIMKIR